MNTETEQPFYERGSWGGRGGAPVYLADPGAQTRGGGSSQGESHGVGEKESVSTWRIQVRRPAGVEPARVEATSSSDCAAAAALARFFRYSAFSRGPISSAADTSDSAANACAKPGRDTLGLGLLGSRDIF